MSQKFIKIEVYLNQQEQVILTKYEQNLFLNDYIPMNENSEIKQEENNQIQAQQNLFHYQKEQNKAYKNKKIQQNKNYLINQTLQDSQKMRYCQFIEYVQLKIRKIKFEIIDGKIKIQQIEAYKMENIFQINFCNNLADQFNTLQLQQRIFLENVVLIQEFNKQLILFYDSSKLLTKKQINKEYLKKNSNTQILQNNNQNLHQQNQN